MLQRLLMQAVTLGWILLMNDNARVFVELRRSTRAECGSVLGQFYRTSLPATGVLWCMCCPVRLMSGAIEK